jgi:hypothetical protein
MWTASNVEYCGVDTIVAFDIVVSFVMPLVALLTSLYSKEYAIPILFVDRQSC